jgi:NADP-dependent 3-hydroxy acid dehydrogenase YdfG
MSTARPVLVTGASSGIGEATARLLAAQGHPVVLAARRVERCQSIVDELTAQGLTAHALPLDVTDAGSRDTLLVKARERVGAVEVLVSNAGAQRPATTLGGTEQDLLDHLLVNVVGVHAMVRDLGAEMVARGRGDLVFIGSEVTRAPRPGVSPYVTSKFALEGMVAVLERELEGTGVRVSTVRPGQTATEMGLDWEGAQIEDVLSSWQHWGLARHDAFLTPADVAAAVAAVVGAPPGVCFSVLEVQPVAPVTKAPATTDAPGGAR